MKTCNLMSDYISYLDIPRQWGLKSGDVVILSSYLTRVVMDTKRNGEHFDMNLFLESVLDVIGEEGTLLIPTFNWDFCHGETFDYYKTKSQTGVLGDKALMHPKFRRTQHALYSFAVAGKDQAMLCALTNQSSFGADSPFAYLERCHAKQVMIDVPENHIWGFTYVHFVEEKFREFIPYRYMKEFRGTYIDESLRESIRTYTMFVRNLDMDVRVELDPLAEAFTREGVLTSYRINNEYYTVVDLYSSTRIVAEDILTNKSRLFTRYNGQ